MIDVGSVVINLRGFAENEVADIRRCLTALYSVRTGTQPLDREFGISNEFLDQPLNIAKNMLALEVIEKTKRYEPRVEVEKVDFEPGAEGQMIPIINLKRGGRL